LNFKAKILFREGTLWTGAVTDPLRVHIIGIIRFYIH